MAGLRKRDDLYKGKSDPDVLKSFLHRQCAQPQTAICTPIAIAPELATRETMAPADPGHLGG